MPRLSILFVTLALGCVLFIGFAYTVGGEVGKAIIVLSLLGLIGRGAITATRRVRRHH
jgi:hypothetical protein